VGCLRATFLSIFSETVVEGEGTLEQNQLAGFFLSRYRILCLQKHAVFLKFIKTS